MKEPREIIEEIKNDLVSALELIGEAKNDEMIYESEIKKSLLKAPVIGSITYFHIIVFALIAIFITIWAQTGDKSVLDVLRDIFYYLNN